MNLCDYNQIITWCGLNAYTYFLYTYSFEKGNRINRERLLALGIISGEEKELRGLKQITREQFLIILKEAKVNESIIVDKT